VRRISTLLAFALGAAAAFGQLVPSPALKTVPTVALLEAFAVNQSLDGTTVQTLGYNSAGDGGGALYRYSYSSAATVDGGSVLSSSTGTGRWLLVTTNGEVTGRQFGAWGDDSHSDGAALQAAANYCAAAGYRFHLTAGTYKLGQNLYFPASITFYGDGSSASLIDPTGNLFGTYNVDIGYWLEVNQNSQGPTVLGSTAYTASGTLYAGDRSLTFNSVSGISTGSRMALLLGVDPNDSTLPWNVLFATVTNINSSTVTFDQSFPENVNGTSHKAYLVTGNDRGMVIRDIGFKTLGSINVTYSENAHLSNLWFFGNNPRPFQFTYSFNWTVDNCYLEDCTPLLGVAGSPPTNPADPGPPYGSFLFDSWQDYNGVFRDITVQHLGAGHFFDLESIDRNLLFDGLNVGLGVAQPNNNAGNWTPFQIGSGEASGIVIRNPRFSIETANALGYPNFAVAGAQVRVENPAFFFKSYASGAYGAALAITWNNVFGTLNWNGTIFPELKQFRYVITTSANMSSVAESLGITGMIQYCRAYATSGVSAHVTSLWSNSGNNVAGALVDGQSVDISSYAGGVAQPYSYVYSGPNIACNISTDSGCPSGSIVLEGVYWPLETENGSDYSTPNTTVNF
jgi:hypothetical protein